MVVIGGNELLESNNHPDYTGKTVVVSGGGNVAMDVSRTIKKKVLKKYMLFIGEVRRKLLPKRKR